MTQTAQQPYTANRRNFSRTWKLDLYGDYGEGPSASVYLGQHIVTLTTDSQGVVSAMIDGQSDDVSRAVKYLDWSTEAPSRREVISEGPTEPEPDPETLTMPAPTIGKARAHALHKVMGILGIPHSLHYGIAAYAIDEPFPLDSLSTLTEKEAGRVWAHLCKRYPEAPAIAQRLKDKSASAA